MDQQKQNKKTTEERRGAKGGGAVRQRPDGRWEARCTINGKRRSFYGDKQSDVLKVMREAQSQKDQGIFFEPNKFTVGKWLDIWLEEYSAPNIKPASYRSRKFHIEKDIKPFLGKIKLKELNATQIQMFYNNLLNSRNLSPKTIKGYHATITSALNQAVKLRYIPFNPAGACTLPRRERTEIQPLSEKEIVAFLETVEKTEQYPYRELFKIALFTGMRRGEVCGLSWKAINFKDNTLTVSQQLCFENGKKEDYYIGTTKSGNSRIITTAPFVIDILKKARQDQMTCHLKVGLAWANNFDLVFTESDGTPVSSFRLYSHFKKIVSAIGRPDARFHDLRHTYAVISLQEGDDPKTVQKNLGHATAEFTLNIYAHVSETMKQESARRLQKYYQKIQA